MDASDHPVNTDRDGGAAAIEEVHRSAAGEERGRELGYRFDAYPKWLEASGWKDQSRRHRAAWPTLRRLLELERWHGAAIRLTYPQLADYLCVSEDTAKRRLRDLAGELGAIELRPGTGRSPSVVVVKHPIVTPLKYDEVPWEAGGLAGAPARYLEDLRGAKRHYAELYGAELPPEPAASGEEAPEPGPPKESEPEAGEGPPTETAAPVPASPEGADCAPLETRESCFVQTSSASDTREDEESPAERGGEKKDKEEKASKEIEMEIRAKPPGRVSNEGRVAALALAESVGRYDELARVRLAQAAQYLISRGEASVLRAVTTRIASARRRGRTEIRDPLAYVARVIQDVRSANYLTAEERDLAASVALASGPSSEEPSSNFREGYEWFFGEEPADPQATPAAEEEKRRRREEQARERRRDYEWFFDRASNRSHPEQPAERDALEPQPWEGSPFVGVVSTEQWWRPVTSAVAGAISRRMADLATAGDADEYRRARDELYAAPWVGDSFKERVIARCDEWIRREQTGARTSRSDEYGTS